MSHLVRVLIAALIGLLLGLVTPSAGVAAPAQPLAAHTYNAHVYGTPVMGTTSERGPPTTYPADAHHADDDWSLGASVCADGPAPGCTTAGTAAAQFAQFGRAAATTQAGVQGHARALLPFVRCDVAANTGSRLAEASSSAFRAADNVGDFTVSAKHLPGAGGRWNKWAEGVDINGTIANALRSDSATFLPNAGGAADSFIVRTNAGSVIGTKGQTYVKAVISNDGRIITAYPVK
jgi:hypothetical protein